MKLRNFFSLSVIIATVLIANYVVFAVFNEPSSAPPAGNTPAPVNVGSEFQKKEGDLEVTGLKAGSINLGGVTRTTWPSGGVGGAACTWEGTKCDCWDDTSTFTDIKLTIGLTCASGQITDFGIKELEVTARSKNCRATPPAGCTTSLYTHH